MLALIVTRIFDKKSIINNGPNDNSNGAMVTADTGELSDYLGGLRGLQLFGRFFHSERACLYYY